MTASPASSSAAMTGPAPGRSTSRAGRLFAVRARRRAAARDGDAVRRQPRHVRADRQLQDRPGARAGDPRAARPMSGGSGFHRHRASAPLLPWAAIAVLAAPCLLVPRRSALCAAGARAGLARDRGRDAAGDAGQPVADRGAARAAARCRDHRRRRLAEPAASATARQATEAALAALQRAPGPRARPRCARGPAGEPQPGAGDDGTRLFTALGRAMSDVPRQRLAGVVMITDGAGARRARRRRRSAAQAARRAAARAAVRPPRRGRPPARRRAGAELRHGRQGGQLTVRVEDLPAAEASAGEPGRGAA